MWPKPSRARAALPSLTLDQSHKSQESKCETLSRGGEDKRVCLDLEFTNLVTSPSSTSLASPPLSPKASPPTLPAEIPRHIARSYKHNILKFTSTDSLLTSTDPIPEAEVLSGDLKAAFQVDGGYAAQWIWVLGG